MVVWAAGGVGMQISERHCRGGMREYLMAGYWFDTQGEKESGYGHLLVTKLI